MSFSLRRLLAITRKELRHITRDFRIFFLVSLSPAFLLVILAYLFGFDLAEIKIAWFDQDRSPLARAYLSSITNDGTFRVGTVSNSYAEIEDGLVAGQISLGVVIPPGFATEVLAGRRGEIQVIADGSDALLMSRALSDLAARSNAFGQQAVALHTPAPVITRIWYNAELKSQWSMVPGLLAIVLTLPAIALTLGVAREHEVGTFEALVATPVTGAEYQLGKLAAYVLSGVVSAALAAAVGVLWFHVPLRGDFGLFLLLAIDFYLACMGLSLLIARFVTSQQTAMLLVLLIFFVPGFFIAGLIMPPNDSTLTGRIVSNVLPATHFIAIARAIFLKGTGLAELRFHAMMLAGIAVVTLAISLVTFRKQIV